MPAYIPNREDFIIDGDKDESNDYIQSDMVRILLNLAFLSEEKQNKFKMDHKFVRDNMTKRIFASIKGKGANAAKKVKMGLMF